MKVLQDSYLMLRQINGGVDNVSRCSPIERFKLCCGRDLRRARR